MERERLSTLYQKYGGMVFRRARSIVGSDSDAEDLVQEVFHMLVERPEVLQETNATMSWFYRTTTHSALNMLRSNQRRSAREEYSADSLQVRLAGTDPAMVCLLREILSDLHPPIIGEAAYYFYLEQMTLDEISEVLDISRRSVANHLKSFRERVKTRLHPKADL